MNIEEHILITKKGFISASVIIGTFAFGFWQESFLAGLFALVLLFFLGSIADATDSLYTREFEREKSEQ